MNKELSEMTLEELWELFPIILKEHNTDYKNWYEEKKTEIIKAIGKSNIKRINHIGSTAVEGLIAKPTVDILLEINDNSDIQNVISLLTEDGWVLMADEWVSMRRLSFNKGYTPRGFAEKVFHLHVRLLGDCNELYFRDYLIEHKNIAEEYGKLKLGLKEKYEHNRDGYTEAKSDFIKKYTEMAKKGYSLIYNTF